MARKEKELHMQLYPGWSARDNYATRTKKKKMKRDVSAMTSRRHDVSAMTSNYETKLGNYARCCFRGFRRARASFAGKTTGFTVRGGWLAGSGATRSGPSSVGVWALWGTAARKCLKL